jgi:hypothetical protein
MGVSVRRAVDDPKRIHSKKRFETRVFFNMPTNGRFRQVENRKIMRFFSNILAIPRRKLRKKRDF